MAVRLRKVFAWVQLAARARPSAAVVGHADVAQEREPRGAAEGGVPPSGLVKRDARRDSFHEVRGRNRLGCTAPVDQRPVQCKYAAVWNLCTGANTT